MIGVGAKVFKQWWAGQDLGRGRLLVVGCHVISYQSVETSMYRPRGELERVGLLTVPRDGPGLGSK